MADDRIEPIAGLLTRAETAHATYERDELNGVYDADWPQWYAAHVVDHGLPELLGRQVDVERLAELLETGFAEFERADRRPGDSWQAYLAGRIAAEL